MRKLDLLLTLSLLAGASAAAGDWPRFRGENFDGVSPEKDWLGKWPEGQPKQLWKRNVGVGFASVTVAAGRVYAVGNSKDVDTIYCFDALTGKEVWKHSYEQKLAPKYYDGGPSATPTVDGDRVFHLSKQGDAICLQAKTGTQVWHINVKKEHGVAEPEWGFAGSPHIEGELVILNAGTRGMALKKTDGTKVWVSGKEAAAYASPVPFQFKGQLALAVFGASGLYAVDPATGAQIWQFPWKTEYDVNAADPVVIGSDLFITSGYKFQERSQTGGSAALIRLGSGAPERSWLNKELAGQLASPVFVNGLLFGIHGNVGDKAGSLRCLDPQTGKTLWTSPNAEPGGLAAADGKLIWITGPGELVVVEAKGTSYQEVSRAQVISAKVWTAPVLSNGRIYARNSKGDVVCVDVRSDGAAR